MSPQFHSWAYAQKKKHGLKGYMHATVHFSTITIAKTWKQFNVPQQKNRYRRYDTYIQWNINEQCRLKPHGWTYRLSC